MRMMWVTRDLQKLGINHGKLGKKTKKLADGIVVNRWTGVNSILDIRFKTTDKAKKMVGERDAKKNAAFTLARNTDPDSPLETIIKLVDKKRKELKSLSLEQGLPENSEWLLWLTLDNSESTWNLKPRVGRFIRHVGKADELIWQDEEV